MLFSWIHLQRVVKIDVEAIAADCEMARCVCTAKMVKGKAGRKRAALWGSSQCNRLLWLHMERTEKSTGSLWEAPVCKEKLQKSQM